jgi:cyclic pyranopterin monophosphate synthase
MAQSKDFTHMEGDRVKMVDVGAKPEVERAAKAQGTIWLTPETMRLIKSGEVKKGNVLATAQIAGITAVKRTWDMIPLCHQIPVTGVDVHFAVGDDHITVTVEVRSVGVTGVEMEALSGVSLALLTIWDMVKAVEKDAAGQYLSTRISDIVVLSKKKGPAV